MKIIIYGKEWEAIQPVNDVLEENDALTYELISANSLGSISDYLDAIGTGSNGIKGVVFAGACPAEELLKAVRKKLEVLVVFMPLSSLNRFECVKFSQAEHYLDTRALKTDLDSFMLKIKVKNSHKEENKEYKTA